MTPSPAPEVDWEDTLLFRALRCRPAPRRPVWMMRQAGRYLPEYRSLRAEAGGFLPMLKTPSLACEVTLQPIRRFGMDAAILFSDILTVPDALGLELYFVEGEGPRFRRPASDERSINDLRTPSLESWDYVSEACRLTRSALPPTTPLIGFCGAPWTLACYMVSGGGDSGFWLPRKMRHERPDLLHRILEVTSSAAAELLCLQINSGAQAVMIFDSWGGLLGGDDYETFSLDYIRRIISRVREESSAPVIVFGRNCGFHLPKIASCGCDGVGVDWQTPLSAARRMTGGKVAVQGNLDPSALLVSNPKDAALSAQKVLSDYGDSPGHIFNLGHGVYKETPPESVAAVVEAVQKGVSD